MKVTIHAGILLIGLMATAHAQSPSPHTAPIGNDKGETIGTLAVTGAPNGVLLHIEAKDLPPGWHGMHWHAKGQCDTPKFESAGGHVHDASVTLKHGFLNADQTDSGDLPNIYAGPDGHVMVELYTDKVTLDGPPGAKPVLLDADGSSLIIHANPDDYSSQPIGGAGPRIACAVLK